MNKGQRCEPIRHDPIAEDQTEYAYQTMPWDCRWVCPPVYDPDGCGVFAYRLRGNYQGRVRVHVSADQRYILFLDGKRIGRGPERGDLRHWMYETYDLELNGNYNLVAITWWISPTSATPPAEAQQTFRPAFMFYVEGEYGSQFNTGKAPWQVRSVDGVRFVRSHAGYGYFAIDPRVEIDGFIYPWGIESGQVDPWFSPRLLNQPALSELVRESPLPWQIRPAMLPAMRESIISRAIVRHAEILSSDQSDRMPVLRDNHDDRIAADIQSLVDGGSVKIPAHTSVRAILDFEDYHCAYTQLCMSGGKSARVDVRWAEALFVPPPDEKIPPRIKKRIDIDGSIFVGYGDRFCTDGGKNREFNPLWWSAGRLVEIRIQTAEEPLTLERLDFYETGYPYTFEASLEASDPRLAKIVPLSLRTLRACSHETSVDCPYYEQLNYAGDTRVQSLVAMTWSRDDRLVRKSIQLFDWSRTGESWSSSRYPTRTTQTIPTFCLWWAAMVYDYARYRGDRTFISSRMPGVRSIIERWREQIDADGLVRTPQGWNFVDWVRDWKGGTPINRKPDRPCGVIHWQLVYVLTLMAELETMMNEPLLAQRHLQTASALAAVAERVYFDPSRGLLADNIEHTSFSQHAQILAILSGQLSQSLRNQVAQGVINPAADLAPTSIYFSHYTFLALRKLGRVDLILDRLALWFDHPSMGLYTLLESPEPSRSDCHAWGTHPIYHYFDSILGIRPGGWGFSLVVVEPDLGPLQYAKGTMVHPKGLIVADFSRKNDRLVGEIHLPPETSGAYRFQNQSIPLHPGLNRIE